MKEMVLNGGLVMYIDNADYELVSLLKCRAVRRGSKNYVVAWVKGRGYVYIHRFLTNAEKGMDVDHIDHDGLNNTRGNLRICTRSDNLRNSRKIIKKTSNSKGCSFDASKNKWRSYITVNKKQIKLGTFNTEKEAHDAYVREASKHYGDFFCAG